MDTAFAVLTLIILSSVGGNDDKDWKLVFKVATGGPFGIFNLYSSPGAFNEENKSVRELDNAIKEHYRSGILDSWAEEDVARVKVAIFDNSNEVAYIIFNGTGSNSLDWFDRRRILDSSFVVSDLISNTMDEFFSIKGDDVTGVSRRFFVNTKYAGCSGDLGFLLVVDKYTDKKCDVDIVTEATVFYSTTTTYSSYKDFQTADCLAVFIERNLTGNTGLVDECICQCSSNLTYITLNDTAALEKRLNELKKELSIMRRSTTKFIRTKVSAPNTRPSATGIGAFLGVGTLFVTICIIIIPDIPVMWRHFKKRGKTQSKCV